MSSSNIFSHPEKKLRDHLHNVSELCLLNIRNKRPDFSSIGIDNITLETTVKCIALSHDFGKSTGYFQDYLLNSIRTGKKKAGPLTSHGLISAIFSWYITGREIEKNISLDEKVLPLIRYLSYQV
ncbi:MAG: CRISPR-associated endonuclease Cas3'', partial [Methanogenium sp.]|nr:CRISPR-associated endonuclease Cas3'' [Methanogenium sp.]